MKAIHSTLVGILASVPLFLGACAEDPYSTKYIFLPAKCAKVVGLSMPNNSDPSYLGCENSDGSYSIYRIPNKINPWVEKYHFRTIERTPETGKYELRDTK